MSDLAVQASGPPAGAESHQLSTQPEAALQDATDTRPESPTHPPDQTGRTGSSLAHQDQDESIDTSYNRWPATDEQQSWPSWPFWQGIGPPPPRTDSELGHLGDMYAHHPHGRTGLFARSTSATPTDEQQSSRDLHPPPPPCCPPAPWTDPIVSEEATTKSETILQNILNTMYESDMFERTKKDAHSRFWSTYERVAKQHDDELIERHNGGLDVLLIFAGLFSSVSSTFIVNMQSSLSPVPSDTTNTLLMILINTINSSTFPAQQASLPVWTGPNSTTIWIQTLAYTSLSSSLLAAFGAVLGKQWLGHFKTSRFGQGSLHERGEQRQKKLDALAAWHFHAIIATLPILLQMSLLFFGIALTANIWSLQHTVASVIMATTAFGFIFYFFTVVSSLKSPDCPFQTPVSTVLQRVFIVTAHYRKAVRSTIQKVVMPRNMRHVFLNKWKQRPRTWSGFVNFLHEASRRALCAAVDLILSSLTPVVTYLSSRPSTQCQVQSLDDDPETRITLERLGMSPTVVDLGAHAEVDALVPSRAVKWVIETSTDTDIIAAAAGLVSEIELPAKVEELDMLVNRLKGGFYACFDPNQQILPLVQVVAMACLRAICRLCVEQGQDYPFYTHPNGDVEFMSDSHNYWHMVPDDPGFLVVSSAVDQSPDHLDMIRLPLSDRVWMTHMLTYRLHKGQHDSKFNTFVIRFIGICLDSKSPPGLVADCLLLAGILVGIQINRWDLARLDKSQAIEKLKQAVMDRILAVLRDEIHDRGWCRNALQLIHPLLPYLDTNHLYFSDRPRFELALKFCSHLLGDVSSTLSEDQVLSKSVASLIHIMRRSLPLDASELCTQEQFDMLVDYHLCICEGTDDVIIRDTLMLLMWLHGSPSTPDRKSRYVDMLMHFMGKLATRTAALYAASAIRSTVASMGRDDESLRNQFSKALASAITPGAPQTSIGNNPFTNISFFSPRDIPYLRLLYALSQEPTWHPRLQQSGHFDNCVVIANTLSFQRDAIFDEYAVPVAHIFAIVDAAGEDHLLSTTVRVESIWPLILRAWRYIFDLKDFGGRWGAGKWEITTEECRAAFPSLVEYARRRWDESEAINHVIELVEKVCGKLDEEDPRREWDGTQHIQDDLFWKSALPVLRKQIFELLDASWRNV